MSVTRAAACAVAVGLAACAPDSLQGSLSSLDSLAFTSVAADTGGADLVIIYKEAVGSGFDVPFQLTVEIGTNPVPKGTVIQLGALDPSGAPIAVASRSVTGDTRGFPAIKSGTLTLNDSPTVGDSLSGSFFLVFDYQNDSTLGQGRTVEGSFQAVLTSSS
ncbi:MAG TPA: hypothetical protein VMB50_19280 [Myxococcales bacterium]|nr:hypothetical protein [Myxococcales bacterium]